MKIQIVLTNQTPYHSSATGDFRATLDGVMQFKKARGNFPLTATRVMPIVTGIETDENGESLSRIVHAPIMPANSLRHNLRMAILDQIFDQFRGKYTLGKVGAYVAAVSGSATGNPDGVNSSFEEIRRISAHPFLGLFGGGPRMMEGRLMVGDALALTQDTLAIAKGYTQFATASDSRSIKNITFNRRVDAALDMPEDDEALIDNPVEALTEYANQAAEAQHKKSQSDEDEGNGESDDKRGVRSFAAHEWIIPGVNWLWTINVRKSVTPAQLGAILSGLSEINGSHLGGMSRLGYGEVAIRSVRLDGVEVWGGDDFMETDSVFEALDAWNEALEAMLPDDFISFAESSEKAIAKAEKKAEEKRAKAEAAKAAKAAKMVEKV